jgi:subtilase family serine protease
MKKIMAFILVGLCLVSGALAAGSQVITGHIPKDVATSTKMDRLPADQILKLTVGLPIRNKSALDALSKSLHDPASPQYQHFLTSEETTARFGPTEHDYQTVIDFLKSNGLTVTYKTRTRMVVGVSGKVGEIEKIFNTHFYNYRRSNGNVFYAPDTEPSIDLDVPILHISGMDNSHIPQALSHLQKIK